MTDQVKKFLFGRRKFAIAMMLVVMSFFALMFDKITGDNWVAIAIGVMTAYGVAEAGEGAFTARARAQANG